MSMLPPLRRGGIVLWAPGSSSATPITPGNGASGTAIGRFGMRAYCLSERSQMQRCGFGKSSSGRRPRPGRTCVHPKSNAGTTSSVTIKYAPDFGALRAKQVAISVQTWSTGATVLTLPVQTVPSSGSLTVTVDLGATPLPAGSYKIATAGTDEFGLTGFDTSFYFTVR